MFTRSCARAERQLCKAIVKQRRSDRKKKLGRSEHFSTPYNLRSSMVRRRGGSSMGTANRVKRIDKSDVAPVRLFGMVEEEAHFEEPIRQV